MINQKLLFARVYEEEAEKHIPSEDRPVFHLSPRVGWMNDPNGFSYYRDAVHLFYQYNPYSTEWDAMHWGHAISRDMLHWEYLPAAMAPDEDYDSFGCYSGSAIGLPDGRQLLLYTGVRKEGGENGEELQTQCVAVGDGLQYEKYVHNPVIREEDLPAGLSRNDFRDPKIWQESDGTYRCIVGTCDQHRRGTILLFRSNNGFQWNFESVLAQNDGSFGRMWECPDFFELDGHSVLLISPQDMLPEGYEYHNGNGTVCLIGQLDEAKRHFTYTKHQAVDYGIDFYAPQTLLLPDGRRIMIGWMQNWDTCKINERTKRRWFGQMTLPRELHIRNSRLYQQPIRELSQYRKNEVAYHDVSVCGEMSLPGIEGRCVELLITLRPKDPDRLYKKFSLRFAQDDTYRTSLSYRPLDSVVKIDRKFSGSRRALIHQRRCLVPESAGVLKMHVILDRFSAEAFLNDGEQVMTVTMFTDPAAKGISFCSAGDVVMDVVKYDLCLEENAHEID